MEIKPMLQDLARAKSDLAEFPLNDSVTPERLARCEAAAMDVETAVTELLTKAWIPKNSHEFTASIVCVNKNLHRVEANIAAGLDFVLLE